MQIYFVFICVKKVRCETTKNINNKQKYRQQFQILSPLTLAVLLEVRKTTPAATKASFTTTDSKVSLIPSAEVTTNKPATTGMLSSFFYVIGYCHM